MASPNQSKLYLSPTQYKEALKQAKDKSPDFRLGQWLVNLYGEPGVAYPYIFYLDDPAETWGNVEIIETHEPTKE